jgi:hypothetical protein
LRPGVLPQRAHRAGRSLERSIDRHAGRPQRLERGQALRAVDGVHDDRLAPPRHHPRELQRRRAFAPAELLGRDLHVAAEVARDEGPADGRVAEGDVHHAWHDLGLLLGHAREVDRISDPASRRQDRGQGRAGRRR